jgi:alpha-tubulin suppressor-like RCC1 family protein
MRALTVTLLSVSLGLTACFVPTEPSGPAAGDGARRFSTIVAGFVHTCALDDRGAAWCWGGNDYSQLGADVTKSDCGILSCSRAPLAVQGNTRFKTLAAGWVHNCGITIDDLTYCWGGGAITKQGYLGDGSLSRSIVPVRVHGDSAFTALAAGDGHTCGLTRSGAALCWGANTSGQLGDGTTEDRAVPVAVATPLRFRSLSAGAYHTCGITTQSDAYCWGDNRWGQLGAGEVAYNALSAAATLPRRVIGGLGFESVVSGWEHTCALAMNSRAYCWGRNEYHRQLGDDSDVTHRGTPKPISGGLSFVVLSAGQLATCGRTAAGDTFCWGGNYYGGLGNGQASRGVGHPVRTLGGPYPDLAIGQSHTCGLGIDRRRSCWGDQSAGQF